ncbi:MAG: benzoyl-CoA 2,3-epoxidase subunit BoxB [Planctomycetota bacterium]
MSVSSEAIPNNVGLAQDQRLQRALVHWRPRFLDWWREMGPNGFQDHHEVYLRTAVGTDSEGWAQFGYVRMPEYRWGIFFADPVPGRTVGFGDSFGQPVWAEVPGEFRNLLRRLVITQGDTEPASVEQQRMLGRTCPSLYDLRNLFQVNVEKGRHLWAMVHLLHSYFGRDGREEAEAMLERRSGHPDRPRILGAFNVPVVSWLDFFMFTTFTDRDGKFQLLSLAESAFEPFSRCTQFMLREEAHHMFVGESGVRRVVERTVGLLRETEDVRTRGGIDLPLVQKHINAWYSVSLDLFGGEISSNAATYFAGGLKGRPHEERFADHRAIEGVYPLETLQDGRLAREEVPLRNAMNEVARDAYTEECARSVERWNKVLEDAGMAERLHLPHRRFHRQVGIHAGHRFDPQGAPVREEEWDRRRDEWLPGAADHEYLRSIMNAPVYAPGKMANWIAPPSKGIDGRPLDYEYVRGCE